MVDFMSFPTPREHILTCGNTIIGMIPDLCLITHFQVGSWPILYRPTQTGNIKRWGIPLMIPNFSRLNNGIFQEKGTTLPIHGFGRILPWTTIEKDSNHLIIQLSSSDATFASYPYEFTCTKSTCRSSEYCSAQFKTNCTAVASATFVGNNWRKLDRAFILRAF